VNGATDSVAAQFGDYLEAAVADFAFYGAANVFGAIARLGGLQGVTEGFFGALGQGVGLAARGRDFDRYRRVGVVAIFFGG